MVLLVLCWVVPAGLCAWGFGLEVANLTTGLARNDVDVTYWWKQWQLICNCALRGNFFVEELFRRTYQSELNQEIEMKMFSSIEVKSPMGKPSDRRKSASSKERNVK